MEQFRPKTPEELAAQETVVSEQLGESVSMPSKKEDILGMSLAEIKERFPVRYEIYLENLRAQKNKAEIDAIDKDKMVKWLKVLNNLDKYIEDHKDKEHGRTLRDRQFNAFEDLRDFLEKGGMDGYIKFPTGVGKTILFTEFVEAIGEGAKTLIVVPTKQLVGQTIEKMEKFAPGVDVGTIYSENKKDYSKNVAIITYQSLIKQIESGTLKPQDYDFLVLDEAHEALNGKRPKTIAKFDKTVKIGFTATPKYSEEKKIKGTLIHELDIIEAVEQGLLSPFSVIIASTNVDLTDVAVGGRGDAKDYTKEQLELAINIESRNLSALELYKKMFDGERMIAYCVDIKHAENVAQIFNNNGVPAAVISSRTPREERDKLLAALHDGTIKIITNALVLTQGFDEPRLNAIFNLVPTLSPLLAEQRGGRGIRLDGDNPNKHAVIVEFLDHDDRDDPVTFAKVVGRAAIYPNGDSIRNVWAKKSGEEQETVEISGLKVITDPEEVMKTVAKLPDMDSSAKKSEVFVESRGILPAQEGWVSNTELARRFGWSINGFSQFASKLQRDPKWVKYMEDPDGRIRRYYSPEFITLIDNARKHNNLAPNSWVIAEQISQKANSSVSRIETIINKLDQNFVAANSGKFPSHKTGYPVTYYSVELTDEIVRRLTEMEGEKNDGGWVVSNRFPQMAIERFKKKYPNAFVRKLGEHDKKAMHVSARIATIIQSTILDKDKIPQGSATVVQLYRELFPYADRIFNSNHPNFTPIKYRAEGLAGNNPEWFLYSNNYEYYAPELVDKIKATFKK